MELAREVEENLASVLDIADIRAELTFLRHIDSQPGFYSKPVVRRALHRYLYCTVG